MTKTMRWLGVAMAVSLSATSGFAKPDSGKEAGTGDDRVICKRETPIGSLIATRKVCLTKAQWVERSTRGNEEARRQMDENAARNATPSN